MELSKLAQTMASGGDARITLCNANPVNRYHASPYPRDNLCYASSTANDLSLDADGWLKGQWLGRENAASDGAVYQQFLDDARGRISDAYGLDDGCDIIFAPSGTDLEYVALCALPEAPNGAVNLLIGADEVGSGCIHSAAGHYFADETALGHDVHPGKPVAGFPVIELVDIPVRCKAGMARDSATVAADMQRAIETAIAAGKPVLAHMVHGSKTGLILPHLDEVDILQDRFAGRLQFVVDACQARITSDAIAGYLRRGMIVMLTGSKFMGGPPFSGFALLPQGMVETAHPLPAGMATIFRRSEFPAGWAGSDLLPGTGNAGLALRIDASLFELERFQRIPAEQAFAVVSRFVKAGMQLAEETGVSIVGPAAPTETSSVCDHPLEMQTLLTLDMCHDADDKLLRNLDFDDATRLHRELIDRGVRLGQPVRSIKLPDGRWGATLRIGLSMPQIWELAQQDGQEQAQRLRADMNRTSALMAELLVSEKSGRGHCVSAA